MVSGCFGAAYAGARVVPLNTRYKAPEAEDILRRSGARLLFAANDFLGLRYIDELRAAGAELPDLMATIVLQGHADGAVTWREFAGAGPLAPALAIEVAGDDISHVQYTSGTTGRAKGAMLRHRAMAGTTRDWVRNVGLGPEDRYMIVSPFFHISGHKTGVMACITAGAAMYPLAVFDPVVVMQRVQSERITVLPGPPTIYQALLEHPRRTEFDLSSLELAVTGAASIPPVLIERMFDELGFTRVISAYGITETTGVVTMCRPGDARRVIAETSGRVVGGVEIRIIDTEGRDLASGEQGEIVVRGYNVMAGYFDDDEATREAIDENGWFHSGDVGWLDEAGNLRITDRIKDLYISGGFNVYPAEVESALLRHPAIAEVAVVGVPDERMGEVGMAFAVARSGYEIDSTEVIAWCRGLANYKVPRYVEGIDRLPVNASSKVTKFTLRTIADAILRGSDTSTAFVRSLRSLAPFGRVSAGEADAANPLQICPTSGTNPAEGEQGPFPLGLPLKQRKRFWSGH